MGRQIELLIEDSATKDSVAEAKTRKLVQEDRVDVILGGIYSSTRQAIKGPAVVEGKKLYIYPEQYERQECQAWRGRSDRKIDSLFSLAALDPTRGGTRGRYPQCSRRKPKHPPGWDRVPSFHCLFHMVPIPHVSVNYAPKNKNCAIQKCFSR